MLRYECNLLTLNCHKTDLYNYSTVVTYGKRRLYAFGDLYFISICLCHLIS